MKNKLRVQIYSKPNSVYTLEFCRYKKWFFPSCLRRGRLVSAKAEPQPEGVEGEKVIVLVVGVTPPRPSDTPPQRGGDNLLFN